MSRRNKQKNTSSRGSRKTSLQLALEQYSPSLRDIALTLFVFGLLVWLYVVAIQITHPTWLSAPMARYRVPPFNWRVDDTGVIAFAVAAFGFFIWRIEKGRVPKAL